MPKLKILTDNTPNWKKIGTAPTILLFTTNNCPACKPMKATLESFTDKFITPAFEVPIKTGNNIANKLRIGKFGKSMPMTIFLNHGEIKEVKIGAVPINEIKKMVGIK